MKQIKLFGNIANGAVAKVDDRDYPLINRYRWNVDAYGYAVSVGNRHKMHRIITAAKPGEIVDHVNGDKLDNRYSNLRIVTSAQNSYNSTHKTGISKYRGVNRANSKIERWEACISINNKQVYIGTFNTAEEAARAYDSKAIQVRGEYARTNF